MLAQAEPHIPLPKDWKKHVRSSLLHVISLARSAAATREAGHFARKHLLQKSRAGRPLRHVDLTSLRSPAQLHAKNPLRTDLISSLILLFVLAHIFRTLLRGQ